MKLFAWGLGYVAGRFHELTDNIELSGTSRTIESVTDWRGRGVRAHLFGDPGNQELIDDAARADVWLCSVPPVNGRDPVVDYCIQARLHPAAFTIYLSATSVYGGNDGGFRDEFAPSDGTSPRGLARKTAEGEWSYLCGAAGRRLGVMRLSGIYGPGRNALQRVAAGQAFSAFLPGQVTSRIHVDDIVSGIHQICAGAGVVGVFNMADDYAAPSAVVNDYAAQLLGMPALERLPPDDPRLGPAVASFMAANRRIYGRRLREDLGWSPQYPSFKEGLEACLDADMVKTPNQ